MFRSNVCKMQTTGGSTADKDSGELERFGLEVITPVAWNRLTVYCKIVKFKAYQISVVV